MEYSVLMSVYARDHADWLRLSVDSMLNQTAAPAQFVLVEDGPLTDALEAVVAEFAAARPELFTVVRLEQNGGLARALNAGLQACRCELVARMDADDIALPNRCEKELRAFVEHPELSLIGGNIDEFIDDPNEIISRRVVPTNEADIIRFSHRRNPFNHPTVMYRKADVIKAGGYNPDRRRAQDYELFAVMANTGYHVMNLGVPLVKFRSNGGNIQRRKNWKNCQAHIDVVRALHRRGISSLLDVIVVTAGEAFMYILPSGLARAFSMRVLRK